MIDRSKPLPIHEFPSLISEVARLKALAGRRQAIIDRQRELPNHTLLERLEIERELLNAAPALLGALGMIRAGDADILYWMLTGVGDDPSQDDIAGLLSRYHDIARKMEENR
jgi:hypothetical protein